MKIWQITILALLAAANALLVTAIILTLYRLKEATIIFWL